MDDPDFDHEPPSSRFGLVVAALGMLAGTIIISSWLRGWRPW